jgi:hypothetical protein
MSSVASSRATLTSGSRQLPRLSYHGFAEMDELQQLAKKDDAISPLLPKRSID